MVILSQETIHNNPEKKNADYQSLITFKEKTVKNTTNHNNLPHKTMVISNLQSCRIKEYGNKVQQHPKKDMHGRYVMAEDIFQLIAVPSFTVCHKPAPAAYLYWYKYFWHPHQMRL